jgi:hypothetical protein
MMRVNKATASGNEGLLGEFLIKKSEKANEHITRHFLQSPSGNKLPKTKSLDGTLHERYRPVWVGISFSNTHQFQVFEKFGNKELSILGI